MSKQNCPRGFTFSEGKKQCVPEGTSIADRLELKYERYFFKEGKDECKPGYVRCPVTKKCIPEDEAKRHGRRQGRGQGKGPMGKPVKEANDLLDIFFDEGFETFGKMVKAEKELNRLLDGERGEVDFGKGTISSRPYDHPKKIRVTADVEECGMMGGGPMNKGIVDIDPMETEEEYMDDYTGDGPNDIEHVPNQDGESLYQTIRRQIGEIKNMNEDDKAAYRAYFNGVLKSYGVSSPDQLKGDKKKEFFNKVDKGWKAKKESD